MKLYNLFEEQNDELDVEVLFETSKSGDTNDLFNEANLEESLRQMRQYHKVKSEAETLEETALSMYDNISTLLLSGCSLAPEFYQMAMSKAEEFTKKAETMV